jgi:hypothetical protein
MNQNNKLKGIVKMEKNNKRAADQTNQEVTKLKAKKRVSTLDKIVEKMFDVKQEGQGQ